MNYKPLLTAFALTLCQVVNNVYAMDQNQDYTKITDRSLEEAGSNSVNKKTGLRTKESGGFEIKKYSAKKKEENLLDLKIAFIQKDSTNIFGIFDEEKIQTLSEQTNRELDRLVLKSKDFAKQAYGKIQDQKKDPAMKKYCKIVPTPGTSDTYLIATIANETGKLHEIIGVISGKELKTKGNIKAPLKEDDVFTMGCDMLQNGYYASAKFWFAKLLSKQKAK